MTTTPQSVLAEPLEAFAPTVVLSPAVPSQPLAPTPVPPADQGSAPPRLQRIDRHIVLPPMTIDQLIEPDHPARAVWRFVEGLDLALLYDRIRSRGSTAGRPPIDPRLLVALWLYALLCGFTSARLLARLTNGEHNAFRWLAGGVRVSGHTLSDFLVDHIDFLEHLFKHSVDVLRQHDLVDLSRVAEDGMRVRASAGAASFRRRAALERLLSDAEQHVAELRQQLAKVTAGDTADAGAAHGQSSAQQRGAQQRAAEERLERLQQALHRLSQIESKATDDHTQGQPVAENPVAENPVAEKPVAEKPVTEKPVTEKPMQDTKIETKKVEDKKATKAAAKEAKVAAKKAAKAAKEAAKKAAKAAKEAAKKEPRVSTTDADATVMKMGDGGYRPACNVLFATTCKNQIIVGVDVVTVGSDQGQLPPMLDQIEERFGERPQEALTDGGFANKQDIEEVQKGVDGKGGCKVYAPVSKPRSEAVDRHAPHKGDSQEVAEWRARMGTAEAKEIYKERAATAECVNAQARNRGLIRLFVRGLQKVKAVALWFATVHNMARGFALLPSPVLNG